LVHALLGPEVQLLAYDHNWDVPSYPLDVLASMKERDTFVGTAWHCYGGEMAPAMDQLHEAYPQYEQHVTECTGGYPDGICDITKGVSPFQKCTYSIWIDELSCWCVHLQA
jgi:O-glycosyl hydrolase